MRFDELDSRLRVYEQANDRITPPGFNIVARLDGRGFTRLTKEVMNYEAPYDERFRDAMLATMQTLMDCGFQVNFAYAQSDEISLWFDVNCDSFGRKHRKWLTVLAAEASARLSLVIGQPAAMDCRLSELPSLDLVIDYFRWRMEDAGRNCLNSYAYWLLRKQGVDAAEATARLCGSTNAAKHELLFANGIVFDRLPTWQKRGFGMTWEMYEKPAVNRLTGESTAAIRRRLVPVFELAYGREFEVWLARFFHQTRGVKSAVTKSAP